MNQTYKNLRALLSVLFHEAELDNIISAAMEQAGTPVSRSRLQGWREGQCSKNYRRMTLVDLNNVIKALVKHYAK